MLKIRLRRMGSRHRPFYRVVVSDSRRTPTASALEEVGYYDPRKSPATLSLNVERVDYWVSRGAQPSSTVKKLVNQARRGPSTAEEAPAEAPKEEAPKAEEAKAEEAPAEEAEAKEEASDDEAAASDEAKAEEATDDAAADEADSTDADSEAKDD